MFVFILLLSALILTLELLPFLKKKNKDWKVIIVISSMVGISLILDFIIATDLLNLKLITKTVNNNLKTTLPAYYHFMKV